MKKCTLALGCFWKPEENFKNKPGIMETEVGYAGGVNPKVTYEEVLDTKNKELNGKIKTLISEIKNYSKAEEYHQRFIEKKKR